MSKGLEPGCLAYIKSSSTNIEARGRFVIAVRPWAVDDVFQIGEDRFSQPRETDVWWIKPAREGDTLPVCCSYQGGHIRNAQGLLAIERAVHLQRIGGPGLVSDVDILRERARDLLVDPSNHIFPDIRELDRTVGRVSLHKITPFIRGPL